MAHTERAERDPLATQIIALRKSLDETEDATTRKALRTQLKSLAVEMTERDKQSSNPHVRMAAMTADVMRQLHDRILERVEAMMEKRMAGALFFKGVYQDGVEYPAGSLVQAKGTVWVVTEKGASGRPGTEGSGWRLLVKTRGANDGDE